MVAWIQSISVCVFEVNILGTALQKTVKLHIEPTVILISVRIDESVDAHLDPGGRDRGSVNCDSMLTIFLSIWDSMLIS